MKLSRWRPFCRLAIRPILVLMVGMAFGVGTCLVALMINYQSGWIKRGPWRTNRRIGSPQADPYTRAQTAVGGIYALRKEEAVYYMAEADSSGEPLHSGRTYRLEGGRLPAKWWSVTVYGEDRYLIANSANRYSFNAGELLGPGDDQWTIRLSGARQPGLWLPSGQSPQRLILCLRLYVPDPSIYDDLAGVSLPSIVREGT